MKDPIRVGTDCSGMEAPIYALRKLEIPFVHEFSSEIDPQCIQTIKANYNPKIIFGDPEGEYPNGDITTRDISLVPDIDLYVCGFPCQPFSRAGHEKGFSDSRGTVFWGCLQVLTQKQPKYFILENVRGLTWHDKGNTFKTILRELEDIGTYNIWHGVLNTKDYGIPQSRNRVYIIGTLKSLGTPRFTPPTKIDVCLGKEVSDYIDYSDKSVYDTPSKSVKNLYEKNSKIKWYDLGFPKYMPMGHSPCITSNTRLWNVEMHRYANKKELLGLQGFGDDIVLSDKSSVYKHQIGNSMSVNVLKAIFSKIFL